MLRDRISREERFWEIVGSESFREAFVGRHPLYRENVDLNDEHFYDVDNLRGTLADLRARKMKSGNPKTQWQLKNSIAVYVDWIEQSLWINAKLDSERY